MIFSVASYILICSLFRSLCLHTGQGYVTPDLDTKFNAAKAFVIVSAVFGAIAFLSLPAALCCPFEKKRIKLLSISLFLATLFQGMVFLFQRSSVCSAGFFAPYFEGYVDEADLTSIGGNSPVTGVACTLSTGSKCAVAATVLYFVGMLLAPAAIPPDPIGLAEDDDDEEEEEEEEEGGAGGGE